MLSGVTPFFYIMTITCSTLSESEIMLRHLLRWIRSCATAGWMREPQELPVREPSSSLPQPLLRRLQSERSYLPAGYCGCPWSLPDGVQAGVCFDGILGQVYDMSSKFEAFAGLIETDVSVITDAQ